MGLLDIFKPKSPLERAAKNIREGFAQPEVRREAMAKLLDLGTEEAYDALLARFTYNSHGNIADESEKRDLVGQIVGVGEGMIPALHRYIEREKALSFAIRALSQIVSKEECLNFLTRTLQSKEPLDHRTTEAKRALVTVIGDMGSDEHAPVLYPYLEDHNDDVQMQTVESIERLASEESASALADVCCRDTHAARVQHRAALALLKLQFNVKPHYSKFADDVKREFALGKKGILARKGAGNQS
jgi:hypothetical protein